MSSIIFASDRYSERNVTKTSHSDVIDSEQTMAAGRRPETMADSGERITKNNFELNSSKPERTRDVRRTISTKSDRSEPEITGIRRNGCLLLGRITKDKDGGDDVSTVYLTRHGVDLKTQSKGLCTEVLMNECVPCFRHCCGHVEDGSNSGEQEEKNDSLILVTGRVFCLAVRSEIFLYTLHVLAIVLGAVKEGEAQSY